MHFRHGFTVICGFAALWTTVPNLAASQAQPSPAHGVRVAMLRGTEGDAGTIASDVDGALLRDLAAIAGIENPTVSPIDYAEIQLTVGCSDEGHQCLMSIAQMLQVDAVVVRHLSLQGGQLAVTLMYFDAAASDEPARVDQTFDGSDLGRHATAAVPALVRKLFGVPEPVVAASSEPEAAPAAAAVVAPTQPHVHVDSAGSRNVGVLTWITLAAGAGVLAGGVALGANAQSGFDSYKNFVVKNTADVARANSRLDSVKTKALAADVLMPTGAAILALGGVLLALDLLHEDKAPSFALLPLRDGVLLSMHGAAEGL